MRYHLAVLTCLLLPFFLGCSTTVNPRSISGVEEARVEVKTGPDGLTNEQRNIRDRLEQDNMVGAVKHLYVMSAFNGACLFYSPVKGKVTSSGKRLSPTTVESYFDGCTELKGVPFTVNGRRATTRELIQDDGTYGSSIDFLYFMDTKGQYRQIYITGGTFPIVSGTPLPMKAIVVTVEQQ